MVRPLFGEMRAPGASTNCGASRVTSVPGLTGRVIALVAGLMMALVLSSDRATERTAVELPGSAATSLDASARL